MFHRFPVIIMSSITCFTSNTELRNAVLEYVQPGVSKDPNSDVAIKYGYPIDQWCVSSITDFSKIFVPPEEGGTLFDDSISNWDVSNGTVFTSMFEGAFAFDQDISKWNVSNAISMDRMFYGAYAFNQNLCDWSLLLQEKSTLVNLTYAFLDTSCPNQSDPIFDDVSGVFSPLCYECTAGQQPEKSPSPTISPSETEYIQPTLSPTIVSQSDFSCFQNKIELELAVAEYLSDNTINTDVADKYGWPINNWCVKNVTDFSRLFAPFNNLDKATFNEDISKWDVSNAVTLESMFERNTFFNQDISSWKLGLKIQNTARMFYGSTSFNQNLCQWGNGINALVNASQMFRGSSCPSLSDPSFENEVNPGPFCYLCDDSGTATTNAPSFSIPDRPTISFNTDAPAVTVITSSPTQQKPPVLEPTQQPNDSPPEPGSVDTDEPSFVVSTASDIPTAVPTTPPITDRGSSAWATRYNSFSILVLSFTGSVTFCLFT